MHQLSYYVKLTFWHTIKFLFNPKTMRYLEITAFGLALYAIGYQNGTMKVIHIIQGGAI